MKTLYLAALGFILSIGGYAQSGHTARARQAATTHLNTSAAHLNTVLQKHLSVWNERDQVKRLQKIRQTYTPDSRVVTPAVTATTYGEIDAAVNELQRQHKNYVFSTEGTPVVSGDNITFPVNFGPPGSRPVFRGEATAKLRDGIITFLEVKLPRRLTAAR
ncbi:hypothetical protein C7T94_10400 [Pedobacter yulinensis]|uniref:SnoaL-like domain-containing protein n=1 Tax=Pedobacter yulinensis TaxID=2126353 RepID=A0A2T3HKS1_9SPHI|nr:nuclear transport factor 2 family protein [Pedobacter yulinensis]PST83026.1 hypothetical protein C7T94_10400 [Pedobacter yulinensis]